MKLKEGPGVSPSQALNTVSEHPQMSVSALPVNTGYLRMLSSFVITRERTRLLHFFLNLAALRGMRALSTVTQDGTRALALKVPYPNHWTSREVPGILLLWWPRRRRKCLPNCEITMEAVWEMGIFQHLVAGWKVSTQPPGTSRGVEFFSVAPWGLAVLQALIKRLFTKV